MFKKSLATFVAFLIALVLSLVAVAPAQAATEGGHPGGNDRTQYGVAAYIYKKVDPAKPASWQNSGPQRIIAQVLGNQSKDRNSWFRSLDPQTLPADVCGPGWAIQQDKVSYTRSFAFPDTITPPTDNIGWPPIYDAKHQELSDLVKVPDCAPTKDASASVSVTPATCTAPATLVLGTATNAAWGAVTGTGSGPGDYSVVATAAAGHAFADGTSTQTFTGSLAGALPSSDPACAPPAQCIPSSSVSYTYDPATNSGVITVANTPSASGELCKPFWVTAASWKYLGMALWGQKLEQVQKLGRIDAPGEYAFSATPSCGQGDVYASFDENDETLDPTPYLWAPSDPFQEHFLHDMGFTGPTPTYTTTSFGCNTVTTEPTSTAPTCTATGQFTLPATAHVTWLVDGVETQPGDHAAQAGTSVTVTAVGDEGWVIAGGTQDAQANTWSRSWTLSFPNPDCPLPTKVTPTLLHEPTTCDGPGSFTLAEIPGIIWKVDGVVTPAGEYPGDAPSTKVVTAELDQSNGPVEFAPGAQTSWTLVFEEPEDCDLPTYAVFPTNAVLTTYCDGTGTLTLGQVDGVSFFEDVNYFVDGVPATSSTVQLSGGTHTVTVTTKSPTDSLDGPSAWTFTVAAPEDCDLPTFGVFPTNAVLSEDCDGMGTLTLGLVDGVSFFGDVNYFVDGVPATSSKVRVAAGTHVVTVTTKSPTDGLDGQTVWRFTVSGATACGELETLAITGADGAMPSLLLAGILTLLGAAFVIARRLHLRRQG